MEIRGLSAFETAALRRDLRRKIKPSAKCVLIALRLHGGGTTPELSTMYGLSEKTVRDTLEFLRANGMVTRSEHLRSNGLKFFTYKLAAAAGNEADA